MSAREFARKVWERKSLPPLWMWRPAWLRRVALALWLPVALVLATLCLLIYTAHETWINARDCGGDLARYVADAWHGRF